MRTHQLNFNGAFLERGFWLYVWRVTEGSHSFLYVGRTGDSSSKYAASPFARLGQHLDVRPKASANMLLRHVRAQGLELVRCTFELIAVGPIFSEQKTLQEHRKYRDIIAPLEAALAHHLRSKGQEVVGTHPNKHPVDEKLFSQVLKELHGRI